jgi:hypothetical protein
MLVQIEFGNLVAAEIDVARAVATLGEQLDKALVGQLRCS